jgi:hypothetical protein
MTFGFFQIIAVVSDVAKIVIGLVTCGVQVNHRIKVNFGFSRFLSLQHQEPEAEMDKIVLWIRSQGGRVLFGSSVNFFQYGIVISQCYSTLKKVRRYLDALFV